MFHLCEKLACEYSRLSFALATMCKMHLVMGANERRLYLQASTTQEYDNVTTPYPISALLSVKWSLMGGKVQTLSS